MIVRYHENKGLYSIVYTTVNRGKLVKFICSNGYKEHPAKNKKNGEDIYVKDDTQVLIFKNKEYCIVEVYSTTEEKLRGHVKIANVLGGYDNISLKEMLNDGGYLNSDLFGNSALAISELIYEPLIKEVNNQIREYTYLKKMNPNEIAADILLKWEENQNYFAGNVKMLNKFIYTSVSNFLNTLHRKEKDRVLNTISIESPITDNLYIKDTIKTQIDLEKEIIEQEIVAGMEGTAKDIAQLLLKGYKVYEIVEVLGIEYGNFNTLYNIVKNNKSLTV